MRIAVAMLLLVSSPALAQQSVSNSNSAASSGASIVNNSYVPDEQTIETTPSAIAPGLTAAGVHSCAGSTSVGMSATGFGVGFGTTHEMKECNRRAYAAALMGLGQNLAALELLCQNGEVRAALNVTGTACPSQAASGEIQVAAPEPDLTNPWMELREHR